jgi:hypothetical protein
MNSYIGSLFKVRFKQESFYSEFGLDCFHCSSNNIYPRTANDRSIQFVNCSGRKGLPPTKSTFNIMQCSIEKIN